MFSGYFSIQSGMLNSCEFMVSFKPKEKSDYDLRFFIDEANKRCGAKLFREDRLTHLKTVDTSLRMRKRVFTFWENQPFCAVTDERPL